MSPSSLLSPQFLATRTGKGESFPKATLENAAENPRQKQAASQQRGRSRITSFLCRRNQQAGPMDRHQQDHSPETAIGVQVLGGDMALLWSSSSTTRVPGLRVG